MNNQSQESQQLLDGFKTIEVERRDRIAYIRFNLPRTLNALSAELQAEVLLALDSFKTDEGVRVIVISGNGKAFSSGYDLGELSGPDTHIRPLEMLDIIRGMDDFVKAIWKYPKPTVAAVQGYCLGGGCELAMLCDFTIAAQNARFGEPEVRMGVGSTLVMPWLVSMKAAKELLMGGALVSAKRAYELGIVSEVVDDAELSGAAERLAGLLATMAPPAMRLIKEGINHSYELRGFAHSISYHAQLSVLMMLEQSEEKDEFLRISAEQGVSAALNWRRDMFKRFET